MGPDGVVSRVPDSLLSARESGMRETTDGGGDLECSLGLDGGGDLECSVGPDGSDDPQCFIGKVQYANTQTGNSFDET